MSRNIIVYDNFYKDPDSLLSKLSKSKTATGRYMDIVCSDFEQLASSIIGARMLVPQGVSYGAFVDVSPDKQVRFDAANKWTCLVFLSKEDGSLKFMRNDELNLSAVPVEITDEMVIKGMTNLPNVVKQIGTKYAEDLSKWKEETRIACKFNRAVFFRSDLFRVLDYQGMTQIFVFGDNNAD